jgi:hypothetical protein
MSSTLVVTQSTKTSQQTTVPTNPEWRSAALSIIKRLAKRRETLTSKDVLDELAKSDVTTGDRRALGSVMREGAALGLIESAGLIRQRKNKYSRGASTLWKSRIYQQPLNADTSRP